MAHFIIVYATTDGHTRRVAERIAQAIRSHEHDAILWDTASNSAKVPDIGSYDAIIVGASIHVGKHQKQAVQFVRDYREVLMQKPTVFFSLSLKAALSDETSQKAVQEFISTFQEETGWTATETWTIAGALRYTKYNFFKRTMMWFIARRGDYPTDTSQDHEFTDWKKLDENVASFINSLTAKETDGTDSSAEVLS